MQASHREMKVKVEQIQGDVAWIKQQFLGNGKAGLIETLTKIQTQLAGSDKKYPTFKGLLGMVSLTGLLVIVVTAVLGFFGYTQFSKLTLADSKDYTSAQFKEYDARIQCELDALKADRERRAHLRSGGTE